MSIEQEVGSPSPESSAKGLVFAKSASIAKIGLLAFSVLSIGTISSPANACGDTASICDWQARERANQEEQARNATVIDEANKNSSYSGQGYVRQADYSAIAWHPNANDVWASARYPSSDTAQKIALRDCERIMGGGCGTAWQVDGYIAVGRGADGRVNWGLGTKKQEALSNLEMQCSAYELGCTEIGVFKSTDTYKTDGKWVNIRSPKNIATVRNLYGVVVSNMAAYDGATYIATGHSVYADAENAAIGACVSAYGADAKCQALHSTGNGYFLMFKSDASDHVISEQTPERVQQVMEVYCKKQNFKCTAVKMIDVRSPGLITHRM